MPVLLDADRLLTFLHHRADPARNPVIHAIYAGLTARIERGDFDREEEHA